MPQEVNTKKPLNNTYEIHLATLAEKGTEQFLNVWILQKVNKVINLVAKREWLVRNMTVRVVGVSNKADEETRIFKRRDQTNRKENFIDLFIPVLWAAAKAIQFQRRSQYSFGSASGLPEGGQMIVTSLGGRMPLAKGLFCNHPDKEGNAS